MVPCCYLPWCWGLAGLDWVILLPLLLLGSSGGCGTSNMAPAHGWQLVLSADLFRLLTWILHVPPPWDMAAGFWERVCPVLKEWGNKTNQSPWGLDLKSLNVTSPYSTDRSPAMASPDTRQWEIAPPLNARSEMYEWGGEELLGPPLDTSCHLITLRIKWKIFALAY